MTEQKNKEQTLTDSEIKTLSKKFDRAIGGTRRYILTERLAPKMIPSVVLGSVFFASSWLGVWSMLPPKGRMVMFLGLAAAAAVSPFLVKTGGLSVNDNDAAKRLDQHMDEDSGRLARTLLDKLAEGSTQQDNAVWKGHLKTIWERLAKQKIRAVKPDFGSRKPAILATAALGALTLVFGGFAGEKEWDGVREAFDWKTPLKVFDMAAWVSPPDKIDRESEILKAVSGEQSAHTTSILNISIYDNEEAEVMVNGAVVPLEEDNVIRVMEGDKEKLTTSYEITLTEEDTIVAVTAKGYQPVEWSFDVEQDVAPTVVIHEVSPNTEDQNILEVVCSAEDDHGLVGGEIRVAPVDSDPDAVPLSAGQFPTMPLPRNNLCSK